MAGVPAAEVAGKSIATLKNELAIDPILFNFELVCGQVVKVDPATGVKYPVPGATVNVYDLVCHWLWFFPPDWPWSWGFRLPECVSELIRGESRLAGRGGDMNARGRDGDAAGLVAPVPLRSWIGTERIAIGSVPPAGLVGDLALQGVTHVVNCRPWLVVRRRWLGRTSAVPGRRARRGSVRGRQPVPRLPAAGDRM